MKTKRFIRWLSELFEMRGYGIEPYISWKEYEAMTEEQLKERDRRLSALYGRKNYG